MDPALEYAYKHLPKLRESKHAITSNKSTAYNCLAWGIGDSENMWWPNENGKWLMDCPEDERIETFAHFFKLLGFEECVEWNHEPGVTKVALFAKDSLGTHFAVQYSDSEGVWSSKIGEEGHDISHDDIFAVEGGDYGLLEMILRYDGDIRTREMKLKLRKGRYNRVRMKPTKAIWYGRYGLPY